MLVAAAHSKDESLERLLKPDVGLSAFASPPSLCRGCRGKRYVIVQ